MSTRDRILDAAEQALRDYGVVGATTKRIARQAGCSEALLYKHFPGKETLLLAVLLERQPTLAHALTRLRLSVGQGHLAAGLTDFTVAAVEFYTKAAGIASGVLADPPLMAGFKNMLAKTGGGPHIPVLALAEIIKAEQRGGRIDADMDAQAAAAMLMGACFHRANLSHFVDLPDDTRTWAAGVVAILLRR
ncbi:TetR/AcrR family transcriptional regulator [Nonomuraea sp. 3N208]|uniref:TetR/AcrR family transcriptional regulator n=1 Tax=Nonomuraea sp. 3N208 TaxID=3457421 RepID=UPI003FCE7EB7